MCLTGLKRYKLSEMSRKFYISHRLYISCALPNKRNSGTFGKLPLCESELRPQDAFVFNFQQVSENLTFLNQ